MLPYFCSYGGIQNLRKHFLEKHYVAWKQLKTMAPPLDHVCIDLNQLLHSAYRTNDGDAVLCNSLDSLFRITKPKKSIVLAVDGPPPFAKLYTCRSRRLESADLSKYTPGTYVMGKFVNTISNYVHKRLRRYSNATVYLSAAEKAGEGELKILQYLHSHILSPQPNGQSDDKVLLVGGDSDLLLQSLSLCQRMRNLVVIQKTNYFKLTDPIFHAYSFYENIVKRQADYNSALRKQNEKNALQEISTNDLTRGIDSKEEQEEIEEEEDEEGEHNLSSTEQSLRWTNVLDIILLYSLQGNDYFPKLRTTSMQRILIEYFQTAALYDTMRYNATTQTPNQPLPDHYFVSKEGKVNYAFLYMLLDRWSFKQSNTSLMLYYQNHLFPPSTALSFFPPSQYLIRHVQHAYRKQCLGFANGALSFVHRNRTFEALSGKKLYYCVGVSLAPPIPYSMAGKAKVNKSAAEVENESGEGEEKEEKESVNEENDVIWFDDCYFENKKEARESISTHIVTSLFPELWQYWLGNNFSHPSFRRYQEEKVNRLSLLDSSTKPAFTVNNEFKEKATVNGMKRIREHLKSLVSYAERSDVEGDDDECLLDGMNDEDEDEEEILSKPPESLQNSTLGTVAVINRTESAKRYLQGIGWYLEMYRTGVCPDLAYHYFPIPAVSNKNKTIEPPFPFPSDLKEYLEDCVDRYVTPEMFRRHAGNYEYSNRLLMVIDSP